MDSVTVRLAFDDYLDAEGSLDSVRVVIVSQDEGPGRVVERLMWPRQVDSLQAVADSVAAEERRLAEVDSLGVVADSLDQVLAGMQAAGDTLGADSIGAALEGIRIRMEPPEPPEEPGPEPEVEVEPPPILPQQEIFVRLVSPLPPDLPFKATVSDVVNINGLGGGGGEASFSWEPPEPPATEEPDTAALVPDTMAVPPDTAAVPPDTMAVPPDTMAVPPDTSRVARPGPAQAAPPEAERQEPRWWPFRRRP